MYIASFLSLDIKQKEFIEQNFIKQKESPFFIVVLLIYVGLGAD